MDHRAPRGLGSIKLTRTALEKASRLARTTPCALQNRFLDLRCWREQGGSFHASSIAKRMCDVRGFVQEFVIFVHDYEYGFGCDLQRATRPEALPRSCRALRRADEASPRYGLSDEGWCRWRRYRGSCGSAPALAPSALTLTQVLRISKHRLAAQELAAQDGSRLPPSLLASVP